MKNPLAVTLLLSFVASTGLAMAQILPGDITIELQPVAAGLVAPVTATHAGDGSRRLFVVDQVGQIRIIQNGLLRPEPFLDLSDRIVEINPTFDERGVLGLAFHPDYDDNGRFFVRYSAPREGEPDEPCNNPAGFVVGCHSAVLAEFAVSADPNVADPTGTVLFSVPEPQFNHNAGHVAFGPDGFLYFTLGDGGGAHDGLADAPSSHGPIGNGQNIFTALGSILRIDVDDGLPYAIPPDNPFVGRPGVDEIYAYGLRNPYRFSFDDGDDEDEDGDEDEDEDDDARLFLADVGQNLFEEIDVIRKGGNHGWVIREGANCFDPFNPTVPPATCDDVGPNGQPLIDPIAEYSHADGIAVVGGFVYRGSRIPELYGKYVFGDFAGRLFYLDADGPDPSQIFEFRLGAANEPLGALILGFGEDEKGSLYVLTSESFGPSGSDGKVFRILGHSPDDDEDEDEDEDEELDGHEEGLAEPVIRARVRAGSASDSNRRIDVPRDRVRRP
jgi:glucose/arabinose dehydrogenase